MTEKEMCALAVKMQDNMRKYPKRRRGQNYFNALNDLHHDLANQIRGTDLDPFYDDKKLASFLEWVGKQMEE
jgi:hypothetical protein